MDRPLTIEHGSTRLGRTLRESRLKIALLIALVEGVLVLIGEIRWWIVVLLAIAAVVLYVGRGREARREEIREGTGSSPSGSSRSCWCLCSRSS